ncbi:dTDP-glucose 4,6-dehydratase [archaeon]|nr:dTDP-glucose 4,6-dehydratase [archaeon]
MKLLVTGGLGFIGSNFIRYMFDTHDCEIVNLDAETYAGNIDNLKDINGGDYKFVKGNICDEKLVKDLIKDEKPEVVVNFAAESHNDRAEKDPGIFVKTNVLGTQNLLDACRKNKTRFHHISTCEVYGDLELDSKDKFSEESRYNPKTPYNASKAGSDHVVRAYFHTFKLPVTISNCGNNYGPYQHPEKLIPLFVTNILEGKKVPLFKSSQNKREWIHVLDHCKAVDLILQKGKIGETYNIGTGVEKSVEEITDKILEILEKSSDMKEYVPDRLQHDKRYLLDSSKIEELGWKAEVEFSDGMEKTVEWYKENEDWWKKLK